MKYSIEIGIQIPAFDQRLDRVQAGLDAALARAKATYFAVHARGQSKPLVVNRRPSGKLVVRRVSDFGGQVEQLAADRFEADMDTRGRGYYVDDFGVDIDALLDDASVDVLAEDEIILEGEVDARALQSGRIELVDTPEIRVEGGSRAGSFAGYVDLGLKVSYTPEPDVASRLQALTGRRSARATLDRVLEMTRVAVKQAAPSDVDLLFGELRSAIASDNVRQITQVLHDFYKYHPNVNKQRVLPYVKDHLKRRLARLEEGDRITLHTVGGGRVDVVVTKDMRSTVAEAPGLPTVMWVRKPRGRKEGTLSFLKDALYYQATLRTQTQRVVWITGT